MSEPAKVVLITGAGRGIGFATAQSFARAGWIVAIAEIDPQTCHEAAATLRLEGARALDLVVDVGQPQEIERAVTMVLQETGAIHALVNNAFTPTLDKINNTTLQDWQLGMDVNLRAAWLCCQAVHPVMKAQGNGAIVNVISLHAWMTQPSFFPYNVAKGGLLALTKALAVEYAKDGIRTNAVAPGWIESVRTPYFFDSFTNPDEARRRVLTAIPQGRMGKPDEAASVIHFLCSAAASYVNGATLVVDGGREALELDLTDLKRPAATPYWQATTYHKE